MVYAFTARARMGLADELNMSDSVAHRGALIGLMLLAGSVRVLLFQGYSDSDPRAYALLADDLSRGILHIPSYAGPPVVPLRIGLYGPVAVLIRLFGLSELAIALYPLLMSLAGCVVAYAFTRLVATPLAALVSAALIATLPFDAGFASLLYPDVIAATWANIGLFLVVLSSRRERLQAMAFAMLAGACFSMSWLCKEAVVYLAPIVALIVIVSERSLTGSLSKLAAIGAVPLFTVGAETIAYAAMTGDPLFRLHETERNYKVAALWFFDQSSPFYGWEESAYLKSLMKRLFWTGPKSILLNQAMAWVPAIGLVAAAWAIYFRSRCIYVVVLWFAAIALTYNFMSTSFAEYKPLVLFDRYLYPILLPSTILAAALLGGHLASSGNSELAKERRFWATIILAILLSYNARGIATAATARTEAIERAVSKTLAAGDVVFSDPRSVGNLVFLREGLLAQSSPRNKVWDNASLNDLPDGSYVLVNGDKLGLLTSAYKYVPPAFAVSPPNLWEKVLVLPNSQLYRVRR